MVFIYTLNCLGTIMIQTIGFKVHTPMHKTVIFMAVKTDNFQMKIFDISRSHKVHELIYPAS